MSYSNESLTDYFSRRLEAVRLAPLKDYVRAPTLESLILPVLKLAETVLRETLGNKHYELSVWSSPATPQIVSYFDSSNQMQPRTYAARRNDPLFYRHNNYKVIELLDRPDNEPQVIGRVSASSYSFLDESQKRRIKSTILFCFDVERPAALVVTSNDPEVFQSAPAAIDLVRCISLAIRAEWEQLEPTSSFAAANRKKKSYLFSWIHLSDIHFGSGGEHHVADQRIVGDAIVKDLSRLPAPVDRVFVTGDIAFKGAGDEYAAASLWLQRVAAFAKTGVSAIRAVPGNHDVQRSISSGDWERHRDAVRLDARALDTAILKARDSLLSRLSNYSTFVRDLVPSHPKDELGWVGDWVEENVAIEGEIPFRVRISGLSTVWVSDENDGGDPEPGHPVVPNMALALSQLRPISVSVAGKSPDLVLVLSHHPPEWLAENSRQNFERATGDVQHLHLCGHLHVSGASQNRRFGNQRGAFRFAAAT